MIVQQINLYQDRFREKRLWISAMQVAAAFLVVVAVAAIWSFLLQSELGQEQQRNRQVMVDRDRIKAELTQINEKLAALLEDDRLDREIESNARQISARKKILNFVAANRFGSGQGFSSYLVALSNLKVDDIWLNKIHLGENYVQIKGSALNANQVPAYFDRFSSENVFQGNRFDLFQLSRDRESDWKVDFEIATSKDFDD
jgi:lipopolysaccharide export LptBFGC system permease protein LptF